MNTENYVTQLIIADSTNRQKAFWQSISLQVLAQAEDRDKCPNIYHAIFRACTDNHDQNVSDQNLATSRGIPFKAPIPNISYTSYIQRVMDTASRAIANLSQSRIKVDHDDTITLGGTGVDFAMEQGDEMGIDASSEDTIRADVEEIYFNLNQVVELLTSPQYKALNLWNADAFFMYAPKLPDENGVWTFQLQSNDWAEIREYIDFQRSENANRPMERIGQVESVGLVTKSRQDLVAPASSEPDFVDDEVPF
jgi:hypothetical protein|tara:strand:- start:63 stop:818 length:756 start_codon:yes stop_codon:yes gene_type:complete